MLTELVQIILPSTVNINNPADSGLVEAVTRQALETLARVAGGSTAEQGQGAYMSDAGELIVEPVTKVYAYTTREALEAVTEAVMEIAEQVKITMQQESVAIIINNVMSFV